MILSLSINIYIYICTHRISADCMVPSLATTFSLARFFGDLGYHIRFGSCSSMGAFDTLHAQNPESG